MNARTDRFPLFDSLRALAALAVVVHHAALLTNPDVLPSALRLSLARLDVGVAVFFLISGFLLYRPFVRARVEAGTRPDTAGYAWRRFLRIVPAYWVAFTVIAIVLGAGDLRHFGSALATYGFGRGYIDPFPAVPQAWSLTVEIVFYAFLPLYAYVMWRLPRSGRRSVLATELAGLGLLVVVSVAYKGWLISSDDYQALGAARRAFPAYLDQFALGMGLAVVSAWLASARAEGGPRRLARLDRFAPLGWAAAALAFWASGHWFGLGDTRIETFSPAQYLAVHYLYAAVAVGLLLPAVFGDHATGLVRRALALRPLLYVGLVSYGVYLYHFAVMTQLREWGVPAPGDAAGYALWALAAAALSVLAGSLSYYVVERPALSLKRMLGREAHAPEREALIEPAPVEPAAVRSEA
jgi:peptidoglycan/LPS O-acetylase OafA/YrhL